MQSDGVALSAEGLGLRGSRGRWVFRDLSVNLAPGELVRIDGLASSGKSALLKVLGGVTAPTRGSVWFRPPVVGFVPQALPDSLPFTAEEYLNWIGRIRGIPAETRRTRIDELSAALELGSATGQRLTQLPDGESRRGVLRKVAIIQALLDEPSLLLLDEPWVSKDSHLAQLLSAQARRLADRGSLVIFTGSPATLRPTRYLLLTGGSMRSSEQDPTVTENHNMRFELTGNGTELSNVPGVVSHHFVPDGLVLTVERQRSDAVIARALESGWSVRRVEPSR